MGGSVLRTGLNLLKFDLYNILGKSEISRPGAAAVPVNAPSARLLETDPRGTGSAEGRHSELL